MKGAGKSKMAANSHRWTVLLLYLILVGCGTSVTGLIQENSELLWHAEDVIGAAEQLDRGLEEPVYDAEAAKHEACQFLTDATKKRMFASERSFMEQFRSDFGQLFVLIFPVGRVERCAAAQERYKETIATLCHDLRRDGISLSCSD